MKKISKRENKEFLIATQFLSNLLQNSDIEDDNIELIANSLNEDYIDENIISEEIALICKNLGISKS